MDFTVRGRILGLRSGAVLEFEHSIKRVLDTGSVLVVLLDSSDDPQMTENVLGVDRSARLLWRVPVFDFPHGNPPYTEISFEGDGIAAYNRSGIMAIIDPATGRIRTVVSRQVASSPYTQLYRTSPSCGSSGTPNPTG